MPRRVLFPFAIVLAAVGLVWAQQPVGGLASHAGPEWKMLYEHDAAGNAVNGSLASLVAAARGGADIRIGSGDVFKTVPHTQVILVNGVSHVGGEYNSPSLLSGYAPVVLRAEPYHAYAWVDTTGGHGVARASIYDNHDMGQSTGTLALRWFARR